ncbi:MAG TPA: hypothetical protein VF944_10680, partial [Candidatus Bathyarchaeia archaeon]
AQVTRSEPVNKVYSSNGVHEHDLAAERIPPGIFERSVTVPFPQGAVYFVTDYYTNHQASSRFC